MARKPKRKPKRNLLRDVAAIALVVSRRHLAKYSHPKSPHTFTQAQLMACLILRAYLKQTYRGIADVLAASDALRAALGLADGRVPHYSTRR